MSDELISIQKAWHEGRRRRRVMAAMKLDEISSVDRPAQEGATAVLLKRDANPNQPADFSAACAMLRKRSPSLSRTDAMIEAKRAFPKLYAEYQAQGVAKQDDAADKGERDGAARPAAAAFKSLADQIQSRDQCSRTQALQKAAREMPPADFAKYRAGG